MHRMAGSFRARSADFTRDKPPEPGDDKWPSQRATRDYNAAVDGKNQAAAQQHEDKATGLDIYTGRTVAADEDNSGRIGAVGGGKLAQGVDAQGFGAIMGPMMQLGGQAMQALTQLFGQGVQLTGQLGGQAMSAGGTMIGSLGAGPTGAVSAGGGNLGVGAGAGLAGGGAVGAGGGTSPMAARGEPRPIGADSGAHAGGGSGDYVHTGGDDTQVRPAGNAMPLSSMGGLGRGMDGGGGGGNGKVQTVKVTVPGERKPEPELVSESDDVLPPLVASAKKVVTDA